MKAFKIPWPACVLASLTFLALLLECWRGSHSPLGGSIRGDVIDIILTRSGQLLILLWLLCWHFVFLWLKIKTHAGPLAYKWWHTMKPGEICKLLLIVCVITAYIRIGPRADPPGNTASLLLGIDQSTNLLVLVLGIVVSDFAGLLGRLGSDDDFSMRRVILTSLVIFLASASFAQKVGGHTYLYRSEVRWTGLWVNPNTFGLLMAVGSVIAVGLLCVTWRPSQRRWLKTAIYAVAATGTGIGLLHSYSRGAWVAFCCGLLTLLFHIPCPTDSPKLTAIPWIRRHAVTLFVVAFSLTMVAFWQFYDTQHRVVRRVLSVRNENDFSSRNRLAAYKGALQMSAEQPWLGFGWNYAEATYTQYDRPVDVDEGMAIQLNDYFTLATTLGLPALFGFITYVLLSLGLKLRRDRQAESPQIDENRMSSINAVCWAGVVVLLVGFFFDGGLFKSALSVPFWILLELGSRANSERQVRD